MKDVDGVLGFIEGLGVKLESAGIDGVLTGDGILGLGDVELADREARRLLMVDLHPPVLLLVEVERDP